MSPPTVTLPPRANSVPAAPELPSATVAGVTLRQLGFTNGPLDEFSLPSDLVVTTAVDQPNVVTIVLARPSPETVEDYLRATISESLRLRPVVPLAGRRLSVDLETDDLFLPAGTDVLVLTHDHAEDFAVCDEALRCPHLGSIGLIGSAAKWQRFRSGLLAGGHPEGEVDRIVRAGITAILNFAPAQVQAPPGVTIKTVNMAMELEGLSYALRHRDE